MFPRNISTELSGQWMFNAIIIFKFLLGNKSEARQFWLNETEAKRFWLDETEARRFWLNETEAR